MRIVVGWFMVGYSDWFCWDGDGGENDEGCRCLSKISGGGVCDFERTRQ